MCMLISRDFERLQFLTVCWHYCQLKLNIAYADFEFYNLQVFETVIIDFHRAIYNTLKHILFLFKYCTRAITSILKII